MIKLPGKNYAVFHSSNQISYESKQLDIADFIGNVSMPTQFVMLSLLHYCLFMTNIYHGIKEINKQNIYLLGMLSQEIGHTVQIIMKVLGEVACLQKNKFDTQDF